MLCEIVDWKGSMWESKDNHDTFVSFEPLKIDKLHFNLFIFFVFDLLWWLISRTCFRPTWDYIDVCDYIKMIEAIWWTIYLNTNPIICIPISEPFESKHKTFSFLNLFKEPLTYDYSDLRASRAY